MWGGSLGHCPSSTPRDNNCGQGQPQFPEWGLVPPQCSVGTPRGKDKKKKGVKFLSILLPCLSRQLYLLYFVPLARYFSSLLELIACYCVLKYDYCLCMDTLTHYTSALGYSHTILRACKSTFAFPILRFHVSRTTMRIFCMM